MDTSGKNINTHYLQGNYYSWLSATAEVNSNSTDTTGLCPKGWQMPKSNLNQIDKSFNKLVLNLTEVSLVNNTGPYYFMYGGYVASNSIAFPGHFGSYWSSTSSESGNAYALTFNNTNSGYRVNPSSASSSYCGMPIRCVNSAIVSSTPVDPSESIGSGINDPNVSVSIPNIITLDVSDSVDITTQSNEVSTGTFTAKVESNQNYSISLNAASDSTALINSKDGSKIAEIPTITTTQPTPGTSSWGIRTCSGLDISSCTELYQPLPAKDITNTFLSDTPGSHQHLFQIGIGISPSLPSGTYSTNILVTANQK